METDEGSQLLAIEAAKASSVLLFGQVIAQTLLGITSVLLIRLLLPEEYGLYAIGLIPFALLQPLRDLGLPMSIQHHLSKDHRVRGHDAKKYLLYGLVWEAAIGLSFGVLLFLSSEFISVVVSLGSLIPILLASIPSLAGMGVIRVAYGASIATGRSGPGSLLMIFTSMTKLCLSIWLVVLGQGALGAIFGFGLSTVLSAIIGTILVLAIYRGIEQETDTSRGSDKELGEFRLLVEYGAPIGIADFTTILTSQAVMFIGAATITPSDFGVFNSAYILYLYIYSLFGPLILLLLTVFSRLGQDDDKSESAYSMSTLIVSLLAGFIGLILYLSSNVAVTLLFGTYYDQATISLQFLSLFLILFPLLGSMTSGVVLLGRGRQRDYSLNNLGSAVLGCVIGILTIPQYGHLGIILSLALTHLCTAILLTRSVQLKLGFSFDWSRSSKMLVAFVISILIGRVLLLVTIGLGMIASLVFSTLLASFLCLVILVRIRCLTEENAIFFHEALKEVPILRHLSRLFLVVIRRI